MNYKLGAFLLLLALSASLATATDWTWNATTNSSWENNTNWIDSAGALIAGYPNSTVDDVIFNENSTVNCTLFEPISINKLSLMSINNNVTLDADLTVVTMGNVSGWLTGGVGDHSLGSLIINNGGTYNATTGLTTITSGSYIGLSTYTGGRLIHNSGTFNFTYSGGETAVATIDPLYNLIISGVNVYYKLPKLTVEGNLTIASSKSLKRYTSNNAPLIVNGLVDISGTLDCGWTTGSPNNEFGSLTINSGGTYDATSGTTTITGNLTNAGTFTHNNGTVAFGNSQVTSNANPFNVITIATGIDVKDSLECASSTITSAKVTITGSAWLVSKDQATTSKLYWVYGTLAITTPSNYTLATSGVLVDGITIVTKNPVSGTTLFTFDTDNFGLNNITVDGGTTIRVVDTVDVYVKSFTNNGTWNKSEGYGGDIHIGGFPTETAPYDGRALYDGFYDDMVVVEAGL